MIGYPVAYYVSRRAGRTKGLLLVLLILPFWVNYLLRMLAWIGLLQPDGMGEPRLDRARHLRRAAVVARAATRWWS